ncbi:MAG: hypothetical protein PVJ65_01320 [Chromatiales bacterium]
MTESKNRRFMLTAMAVALLGTAASTTAEDSYTFRPLDAEPFAQYPAAPQMPMPPVGQRPAAPMMQGPMAASPGPYGAPPMGPGGPMGGPVPMGPGGPMGGPVPMGPGGPMGGPVPMGPGGPAGGQMPMRPTGPMGPGAGQMPMRPSGPPAPATPGSTVQRPAGASPGGMPPPRYGNAPYQRPGGPTWGGSRNPFNNGPWGNKNQSWRPESWFSDRRPIFGRKGPSEWIDRDDYKDGLGDMWDDMLNAPANMGKMPGGWYAPTISVPNPVDVGDEFENAATDMPGEAREQLENFSFDGRDLRNPGGRPQGAQKKPPVSIGTKGNKDDGKQDAKPK